MDIHIFPALYHIWLFWFLYLGFRWLYTRLHQNYRWQQRGNKCYELRRVFSITWAIVAGVFIEIIIIHQVIKIHL